MKEKRLAERYARALVSLSLEEKSLERFRGELDRVRKAVELEPQILKFISLRELAMEKREAILRELMLKLYLSVEMQNFFNLLLHRGRIGLFPLIAEAFENLVREIENVVVANVKVAEATSAKQMILELKKALEKIVGKKVELNVMEEPSLMGGFQVVLGGTVYDASIQGELERIKEEWN